MTKHCHRAGSNDGQRVAIDLQSHTNVEGPPGDTQTHKHHDLPAFRLIHIASKLLHLNQWKKNFIYLKGILAGPRLLHPSLP